MEYTTLELRSWLDLRLAERSVDMWADFAESDLCEGDGSLLGGIIVTGLWPAWDTAKGASVARCPTDSWQSCSCSGKEIMGFEKDLMLVFFWGSILLRLEGPSVWLFAWFMSQSVNMTTVFPARRLLSRLSDGHASMIQDEANTYLIRKGGYNVWMLKMWQMWCLLVNRNAKPNGWS